ncbi:MAG: hypothetical protein ACE5ER_04775 [Nitrospinaceae bacterium]
MKGTQLDDHLEKSVAGANQGAAASAPKSEAVRAQVAILTAAYWRGSTSVWRPFPQPTPQ